MAIWFTNPDQGRYWLRNILKELNLVIARGKGPQTQVAMISVEMTKSEKSHASASFTDYIKKFKMQAHKRRVESLRYQTAALEITRWGNPQPVIMSQPLTLTNTNYQPNPQGSRRERRRNQNNTRGEAQNLGQGHQNLTQGYPVFNNYLLRVSLFRDKCHSILQINHHKIVNTIGADLMRRNVLEDRDGS